MDTTITKNGSWMQTKNRVDFQSIFIQTCSCFFSVKTVDYPGFLWRGNRVAACCLSMLFRGEGFPPAWGGRVAVGIKGAGIMKKTIQSLGVALMCGLLFAGCSTFDFAAAAAAGDREGMISSAIDMAVEGAEMAIEASQE